MLPPATESAKKWWTNLVNSCCFLLIAWLSHIPISTKWLRGEDVKTKGKCGAPRVPRAWDTWLVMAAGLVAQWLSDPLNWHMPKRVNSHCVLLISWKSVKIHAPQEDCDTRQNYWLYVCKYWFSMTQPFKTWPILDTLRQQNTSCFAYYLVYTSKSWSKK